MATTSAPSTEIGVAYVSIVPSARGMRAALQGQMRGAFAGLQGQASGAAASAGATLGRGITSGVRTAVAASAGLLAGVAAGIAAAGTAGLKTAADLQQTQIAFTTLLGSGQAAAQMMGDLEEFARTTPFDLPGLTQAAQHLMAFGVAGQDVLPYLTAIGDAAAATGRGAEGIDRISNALGQMLAKGRVQSEELLQLNENNIPALQILAESVGVTTAQMQDMVTAGAVPAKEAVAALVAGMEHGAGTVHGFGGMMAAQAKTLAGTWENLKDSAKLALAEGVEPTLGGLTEGLARLAPVVEGVAKALGTAFGGALSAVAGELGPALADVAGQLAPQVGELIGRVAPVLADALPVVAHAAQAFAGVLGAAMDALAPVVDSLSGPLTRLADTVGAVLADAIRAVAPLLPVVADALGAVLDALAPALPALGQLAAQVASALRPALEAIAPVLPQVAAAVADVVAQLAGALGPVLAETAPMLAEVGRAVAGMLLEGLRAVGPLVRALLPALTAGLGVLRGLWPAISALLPVLVELAGSLADVLVSLTPLISAVAALAGWFAGALGTAIGWVVEHAVTPLARALAAVYRWVADHVSPALRAGITVLARFGAAGLKAVAFLVDAFGGFTDVVLSALGTLVDGAANALGWLPGVGDRLDEARGAFHSWQEGVKSSVAGASGKLKEWAADLDAIDGTTVGVDVQVSTTWAGTGGGGTAAARTATDVVAAAAQGITALARAAAQAAAARTTPTGATAAPHLSTGTAAATAAAKAAREKARAAAEELARARTDLLDAIARQFAARLAADDAEGINTTLGDLQGKIRDAFSGAVEAAMVARVAATNTRLVALAKERDGVAARLEAAQSRLDALVQARAQMASDVAGRARLSVADVTGPGGGPVTARAISSALMARVNTIVRFDRDLKTLAAKGLPRSVLADLVAADVESGAAAAAALVAADAWDWAHVVAAAKEMDVATAWLGSRTAGSTYDSGVKAAQGIVAGLRSQRDAVATEMAGIARLMVATLRRALGIRSPSRVMAGVGLATAAGLRRGLAAGQAGVDAAVAGLVDPSRVAAVKPPGVAYAPGAAAAGRTLHIQTLTVTHPAPEPVGSSVVDGLRRAAWVLGAA